MMSVDDGFYHWLAGFVDGEGCFTIGRKQSKDSKIVHYCCVLSIKLRDDDRSTLSEIWSRTGIGALYDFPERCNSRSGTSWIVAEKIGCLRAVEIFDKFPLRAKKSRDYAIWRLAVKLWNTQELGNRHWGSLLDTKEWETLYYSLKDVKKYIKPKPINKTLLPIEAPKTEIVDL